MFDDFLRELKDRLAEPLARRMKHINPIAITVFGFVIGLGSAIFALFGFYFWALIFWLLNRGLDGLDGLVARIHQKQDDFGGYLDILLDFIIYAALPIAIVLGAPSQLRYIALIGLLAIFYINTTSWMYLAAILEKRSSRDLNTRTTIVMPSGLVGGFETIVFYAIFLLFPGQITALYLIFSILIVITILQRFVWAVRILRPAKIKGLKNETKHSGSRFYIKKQTK